MILHLGDMRKEALRKTNVLPGPYTAVFIAKREHVYGKKTFFTKAQFSNNGRIHDLKIECDTISTHNPCLIICLDSKNLLQVKRVRWKFRGNGRILVDGQAIEVFWDVYSWLFGTSLGGSGVLCSGANLLCVTGGCEGAETLGIVMRLAASCIHLLQHLPLIEASPYS